MRTGANRATLEWVAHHFRHAMRHDVGGLTPEIPPCIASLDEARRRFVCGQSVKVCRLCFAICGRLLNGLSPLYVFWCGFG